MIARFKDRLSSSHRKTLTLGLGTAASQAITIAASFIVTFYYSPEQVGEYSILVIIIALLSLLYTLKIDGLILVAKNQEEARQIYAAANMLSLTVTAASFAVLLVLKLITDWIPNSYYLLLPFLTWIFTAYNMNREICIKNGNYQVDASANVLRSLTMLILQVLFSYISPSGISLVAAKAGSEKAATWWILNRLKIQLPKLMKSREWIQIFKNYKIQFVPLFKIRIWQNISNNAIFLYWSYLFDLITLGLFHFAFKVTQLPSLLIADTVYRVFEEDFSSSTFENARLNRVAMKLVATVTIISTVIFGMLLLTTDIVVTNIFPEKWHASAAYIKVLGVTIIPVSVSSVLLSVFKFKNKSVVFERIEFTESIFKNSLVILAGIYSTPIIAALVYSCCSFIFAVIKAVFSLTCSDASVARTHR